MWLQAQTVGHGWDSVDKRLYSLLAAKKNSHYNAFDCRVQRILHLCQKVRYGRAEKLALRCCHGSILMCETHSRPMQSMYVCHEPRILPIILAYQRNSKLGLFHFLIGQQCAR